MSRSTAIQAEPPQVSAESITEISLERRCAGCDREMKLTVERAGTATRILFGNARRGTVDRQATAAIAPGAFDVLARSVVADGFFQLRDEYRDPAIMDGESMTIRVTSGARQKSVLHRDGMAPPELQRLQRRIEDLGTTLMWKGL